MNILTLSNLYDFSINNITSGTNNTNTLDYTLLYSTNESSEQQNKKIFKIKLSEFYDSIDPNTLNLPSTIIEDTQIDATRK